MPSIIMMVFTSIYGVVDGFFVSNFAGKTAFASVNLIFPFIMILGGMGFMIGTGGTALVSLVLGTGDREKADRYFSMMVYLTLSDRYCFTSSFVHEAKISFSMAMTLAAVRPASFCPSVVRLTPETWRTKK